MKAAHRNSIAFVVFVILLVASAGHAGQGSSSKETTYKSPDGSLLAAIKSFDQPEAGRESEVKLLTASGRVLARRSYRSEDGEHGYGVTNAQWTPDSQFFLYSLESPGGHQAWHSRVYYFSRQKRKVFSLDDSLNDAVTNPQFTIEAPDKVTVELFFARKKETVSLSALSTNRASTN